MAGYPVRHIVFDTESYSAKMSTNPPRTELTLRLGVAFVTDPDAERRSYPRVVEFADSESFHSMIADMPLSSKTIYVFAHNMGFDVRMVEWFRYVSLGWYSLLPPEGTKGGSRYKIPLFIGESPPFLMRLWRSDGQQLMLLDTYQWIQRSLADIGEWLGMPKGTMPADDAPEAAWYDYCRRDVEVTHAALMKLWRYLSSFKAMDFMPTPASQAMMLYRTRFEKRRITRTDKPETLALDRHGYYGGRVDCFTIGTIEETVHHVDVTGLYPSVMLGSLYPAKQVATYLDRAWSDPPDDFEPGKCTAEVWIESDTREYPVRARDGTYYCTGRVRTILCGPELERAWIAGDIRFIGRYVRYDLLPLFDGYVKYLWACRRTAKQNGDKMADHLSKAMLNALHGKFGQKIGDWVYQGKQCPQNIYSYGAAIGTGIEDDTSYRVLAGHAYHRHTGQEDPRGYVPIAAWCTAYGRVFMDEMRSLCGESNVHYQATDSLLLSGTGLAQLQIAGYVRDHELGYFNYEGSYPWVSIHGIHDLDLGEIRKRPGVKRNALKLSDEIFEQEEWEGFSVGVFSGKVSSVSIQTVCKNIRHGYAKRLVDNGPRTRPVPVDNWSLEPEQQKRELLRRS